MLAVKRKNENILTWYWTSCQRKNYGKKCANNYQHKATRKCGLKNSKTDVDYKEFGFNWKCCKYSVLPPSVALTAFGYLCWGDQWSWLGLRLHFSFIELELDWEARLGSSLSSSWTHTIRSIRSKALYVWRAVFCNEFFGLLRKIKDWILFCDKFS